MQQTNEVADRLVSIASELMLVAKLLVEGRASEPVFPEEAVHKYVAGVCLTCGRLRKNTKGTFRRGNCPTCSNKVNRELDRATSRDQLERQLINDGLLAPKDFKLEPDPIKEARAKVAAQAGNHFADPGLPKPGRKRISRKK